MPLCEYCRTHPVKSKERRFCSRKCSAIATASTGGMEKRFNVQQRVMSLADRLTKRLVRSSPPEHCPELGPCLVWTGCVNPAGYGQINRGPRGAGLTATHRASWEINFGPIPVGMNVLHKCDNPPCCEPSHLFLGSIADNNADMLAKGRYGVTAECLPRGMQHPNSKLTEQEVGAIRLAHAEGATGYSLARQYGISTSTMNSILRRKTWTHVA